MKQTHADPTLTSLVAFWLPLAFMWLVMGIEQPIIGAVVSRLPDPKVGLAAFEVGIGLVMVFQSPVIHMLSAATAVARGVSSFAHLSALLGRLVVGLTGLHAIVCIPPVFGFVVERILQAPPELTAPANLVVLIMLPITAGVGYRRIYQGAMIRAGMTKEVSIVMVVRLAATAAVLAAALLLPPLRALPGYAIAAVAFISGIVVGWVAAWALFRARVEPHLDPAESDSWSSQRMTRFYLPLGLTSVIVMSARPLMTFAISRADEPLTSLAAWPVVQGFLFIFTAIALSFQEVVIAYTHPERRGLAPQVRTLGLLVAGCLLVAFLASWFSGITRWWYETVVDVPADVFAVAYPATIILVPLMLLSVANSVHSGMLVGRRITRFITFATVANVAVQIALALIVPAFAVISGTRLAALILVFSVLAQGAILFIGVHRPARIAPARMTPA